jgi:hypothetical protein
MHQIPAEAPPLCTAVTIDDHVPGTIVRPLAGLERNVARMSCYPRYERNADFSLFALQMFFVLCEITYHLLSRRRFVFGDSPL